MEAIRGPSPAVRSHPHLTHPAVQRLIGQALVDPSFRAQLLNGNCARILPEHSPELPEEQRAFLLTIRADTLGEFAQAFAARYRSDDSGQGEPLSSPLLPRP